MELCSSFYFKRVLIAYGAISAGWVIHQPILTSIQRTKGDYAWLIMKTYFKFVLLVMVTVSAGYFFIGGFDGKTVPSLSTSRLPQVTPAPLSEMADKLDEELQKGTADRDKTMEIYKWRDEKGVWNYSNDKRNQQAVEIVEIKPNANVLHIEPAHKLRNTEQARDANGTEPAFGLPFPGSIDPGQIPVLVRDAKNIEKLQQNRVEANQ